MAHMCLCICTAMCQRVYTSVPWETGSGCWLSSSIALHFTFLRQGLSLKLVLADSAHLTGQWALASSCRLHSAGITGVHPHNHICMCWESELRSSHFGDNRFPDWAVPTSPSSPLRLIKCQGLHFPLTGICYLFKSFLCPHTVCSPRTVLHSLDTFPASSSITTQ